MKKILYSLFVTVSLVCASINHVIAVPLPKSLVCSEEKPCSSPVGNWLTIDDKTQHPRAVIQISMVDKGGVTELQGYSKYAFYTEGREWSNTYRGSYHPFKGKLVSSFPIMWGYQDLGDGRWGNGKVFDIDGSKVYSSHLSLKDHGAHLKLSGCVLFMCRSQLWIRLNDAQFKEYQRLADQDEVAHPRAP